MRAEPWLAIIAEFMKDEICSNVASTRANEVVRDTTGNLHMRVDKKSGHLFTKCKREMDAAGRSHQFRQTCKGPANNETRQRRLCLGRDGEAKAPGGHHSQPPSVEKRQSEVFVTSQEKREREACREAAPGSTVDEDSNVGIQR